MTQNPSTQKGSVQTILWWIVWITSTIVSFFIAAAIWTPIIANRFGSIYGTSAGIFWVIAVFGTWMLFLVPMIIFMYQKVDLAYEDARIGREKKAQAFRSVSVESVKRVLPEYLSKKIKDTPETIEGGHLVTVLLKSGGKFENVFVRNRSEILGVYDVKEMPFEIEDISDILPADLDQIPQFNPNRWLRLDGVKNAD